MKGVRWEYMVLDSGLWVMGYDLSWAVMGYGLWVMGYGPWVMGHGSWVMGPYWVTAAMGNI